MNLFISSSRNNSLLYINFYCKIMSSIIVICTSILSMIIFIILGVRCFSLISANRIMQQELKTANQDIARLGAQVNQLQKDLSTMREALHTAQHD